MSGPSWLKLKRLWLAAASVLGLAGPAAADPAIWVVKDADSTVYLLGTIHVLKSDVKWRNEKLETAFKQSDEYWMEADIQQDPAIAQTYILNFGMDSRHLLSEKLSADDYARLVKIAAAMNLREEQVAHLRPWLATLMLTDGAIMGNGYDAKYGVDRALETDAKTAGKPVKTFETPEQQLGFLADLPNKVELEMLVQALRELRVVEESGAGGQNVDVTELDAMEAAWLAGDIKQLYDVSFKKAIVQSPEFYDVLITKRNANWIPQIEALMKAPGTYFIAVGAGHLIGDGGVPALLSKRGYKVARY